MPATKKPIPAHAYSFSAGILLAITTTGLYFTQEDQTTTCAFAIATATSIAHGLYDLNKEGRLGQAFGLPFFKRHAAKVSNAISTAVSSPKMAS